MHPPPEQLIGRSGEIEAIEAVISGLAEGRGRFLMFVGEPGIGKSTLARHATGLAARHGAAVYCGYCWEAGGAPAYWPWTQLLRSLAGEQSLTAGEQASLALLLPEFAPASGQGQALQPDQERFALLDSIRMILSRIAAQTPLVLLFEDLHAADRDSLNLLRYLARHIGAMPVMVIATYREFEARASTESAPLWGIGRDATVLNLTRLAPGEVAEYLKSRTGRDPSPGDVSRWFEITSGNPLFLSELVGLLDRSGVACWTGNALPATLEQVLSQQIGYLPRDVSRLLSRASILGKSFSVDSLASIVDQSRQEVEKLLSPASHSGIVMARGAGRYEFSHGLYRDVLYSAFAREDRSLLHLRYAQELKSRVASGDEDGWSELAAHLAAAGQDYRGEAIDAWRHAADRARSRLAFNDAAALLGAAVETFGEGPRFDPVARCRLLIDCAEVMLLAGDIEGGHARCEEAFAIARTLEDAELMSAAALTYGSAIVVAAVDQVLINMLQDCLDALPPRDDSTRARVQARLAAALQPALDPAMPMATARDAISKARASKDGTVLYDTLRYAISALMDFAPPAERRVLNQEFLELARESGDVPAQFRSHLRLMIDAAELADRVAFDAAIDAAEKIAERIGLPHYQWRVASARAMQAIIEGRFADALHCLDQAQSRADRIDDLEPRITIPVQRFAVLLDWDSQRAGTMEDIQERLEDAYAHGMKEARFFIQPFIAAFTLTDAREARKLIGNPAFIRRSFAGSDRFSLVAVSLLAKVAEDDELAQRAFNALAPHREECAVTGLLGSVWCGPVALELGRMAMARGDSNQAREFFETALDIAERMASGPFIARIHRKLAGLARIFGDTAAAEHHAKIASELFTTLEMRVPEGADGAPETLITTTRFTLEPQGEVYAVSFDGDTALVRQSKGMEMLAMLISRPDTEIHVMELTGASAGNLAAEAGCGPALDAPARDAYRKRARELREELEEAESMADIGRADELRGELDFITRELSRAFGLGGRSRPQGKAAERARVNVRRRIKDAIERIAEHNPGAGRYLENTIKTGLYCKYSPM